jgi:hypothetical protein
VGEANRRHQLRDAAGAKFLKVFTEARCEILSLSSVKE